MHEYKVGLSTKTIDDDTFNEDMSKIISKQMSTFECSQLMPISKLLHSDTDIIETTTILSQLTKLVYQWK